MLLSHCRYIEVWGEALASGSDGEKMGLKKRPKGVLCCDETKLYEINFVAQV